jgi:hypothetical protein
MLDDTLLPKEGRQVRCIACHHVWRQVPDQSTFMNIPLFISGPEAALEARHYDKRSSWMKWILFLGIISILIFGIFSRDLVVKFWPKTERFYNLLGLEAVHPGAGLSILNATSFTQQEGSLDMIQVAGDVVNTSDQVRPIPVLKIKLIGASSHKNCKGNISGNECILEAWDHRLSENSLLPGEQIHFETIKRPKVEGIHHISVEF